MQRKSCFHMGMVLMLQVRPRDACSKGSLFFLRFSLITIRKCIVYYGQICCHLYTAIKDLPYKCDTVYVLTFINPIEWSLSL